MNSLKNRHHLEANIKVRIFGIERFVAVADLHPQPEAGCVRAALVPGFTICCHDKDEDGWVSRSILESGVWEAAQTAAIGGQVWLDRDEDQTAVGEPGIVAVTVELQVGV